MKRIYAKFAKLIFFLSFLALVIGLSSYLTFQAVQRSADMTLVSVLLADLNDEMDLLDRPVPVDDDYVRSKTHQLALNKIMLIAAIKPEIEGLRGPSLEAICRLASYDQLPFLERSMSDVYGLAFLYLRSVRHDVNERISALQENFKGSGCFITPRNSVQ